MARECAECGRTLPESSYTANQFAKGASISRYAACVHGHSARIYQPEMSAPPAKFSREALDIPLASGAFRLSVDKALEIVSKFNELNIASKNVIVNIPEVWTFEKDAAPKRAGSKALTEPFIENYVKFNSNSGWTDSSQGWPEIMQALSHFSYHLTGGNFVLCDLQGGIYREHVVLSDPVILSRNRDYGITDLGPDGISTFLSQRRCNDFCRSNWIAPANPRQLLRVVQGTTMMRRTAPTHPSRNVGTSLFSNIPE